MASASFKYIALLFIISFCSCLKKELPVKPHDPGTVITATVNMNSDYKSQLFYSLETNAIVSQNLKTIWDMAFEASAAGWHIVLNSSKSMFALNTGKTDFSLISYTDTIGFSDNRKWDEPSGNLDSTAIGDWRSAGNVFIVDRGFNEIGQYLGFRKVMFMTVTATQYNFRYANLDGTGDTTITLSKDSAYNFISFSFDSHSVVPVEPPKADWDIEFTQYTHIFYDPIMPYQVTGCLLNRYQTEAIMDSLLDFSQLSFDKALTYTLSPAINSIGYSWKGFTGSKYITDPKKTYIIRNSKGFYYKLHFIDFYNTSGAKGNPKWEFQRL